MFTVVAVDDHPVVREAVALACELNPVLRLVAEASDGAGTIEACSIHKPDVVVVDLMLPDISGADLVRTLKQQFHQKVLVLTFAEEAEALLDCVSAGADGF